MRRKQPAQEFHPQTLDPPIMNSGMFSQMLYSVLDTTLEVTLCGARSHIIPMIITQLSLCSGERKDVDVCSSQFLCEQFLRNNALENT